MSAFLVLVFLILICLDAIHRAQMWSQGLPIDYLFFVDIWGDEYVESDINVAV